jgi:predicted AlkP superfamily phosphohydrolase/phosphomutase
MSTRTLFIGLDGATFKILDDLTTASNGRKPVMPFFSQIYKKGVRAALKSTPNPLTPPAWVSLMTGRSPGYHGVFDFIRAQELSNDVYFTLYDSRDCQCETIWSIASRQGKRFAALNFPFTAPPQKGLNGFMVPGFIPWRHLRRNTLPSDLYDRLKNLPGFEPKELAWDFEREKKAIEVLNDQECEEWVRYHLPREKQWFRIAKYLLEEEKPDLMAIMFDGTDKLQHQAWRFLDPDLQNGEGDEYHRRMRLLCLEYFAHIDKFIEGLVNAAGPTVQVFLASDHGFTTTYEVLRINTYLQQKGYLEWKAMPDTENTKRREKSMFANLDWQKTTAYCRTPSSNGITIRNHGNPDGKGVLKSSYEAFRKRLIEDLEQLRDPKTGERIIQGIYKREDVFSGPAMLDAPDLLLKLRDSGFVSIANKFPVLAQRDQPAGTHHPEGIFYAFGPGIKQNEMLEMLDIKDIAATLLYSLGLHVPSDFEGRVPMDAFEKNFLESNPILTGPATINKVKEEHVQADLSEDEKNKVVSQLQMLGYME